MPITLSARGSAVGDEITPVVSVDYPQLALGFHACCPRCKDGFRASLAFPSNLIKLFIGWMFKSHKRVVRLADANNTKSQ